MKPPVSASPARRFSFRLDGIRVAAIFAALVFGWSAGAMAQGTGRPPMLLSSPSAKSSVAANIGAQVSELAVTRQRPVAVDLGVLDPQSSKAAKQIAVELFDGQVLTLVLDRVEQRAPGNFTWHGQVLGQSGGQAILTVVAGKIAGSVVLFDSGTRTGVTYQIQSDANGATSLRQVNPSGFPPDHPSGAEKLLAPPSTPAGSSTAADVMTTTSTTSTTTASADSGDTIDVMVVYSDQTATAAGATIGTQIQQAVDRANTAYANSGITTRLRLVHYEPANYSESGDFNTDLNRLTNGSDGYMDNVQTLRNTYGADLVSLFIETTAYCGIAWIGPSANYGFSVVNRGCSSGNLSFAHELGHNFGARHDPYVDGSTSPYAYGHGLTDSGQGWRTVMAYNSACSAAGTSCTRIPYFSNPNLTYGNPPDPLGTTSTSDNARVHNGSAATVAGFRLAVTGGCTYTLSSTGASIGAGAASGSFSVTAGTGCAWNSASSASWLTIGAGSGTTDSGTLNYAVTANAGPARSATITVGTQAFTVSQGSGCTYTLNPTSASVGASGGTGSFTLTTGTGCTWSIGSGATWLVATSATSGTGSTTVNWSAGANTGAQRSANLSVGGATFMVMEAAATAPSPTPSAAVATMSASSLGFGTVSVGKTSAAKSVTLTNSGGGTLTIASLTAGGANPGDFARAGTCAVNTALTSGQSCTLQYTFTPSAKSTRSASLAVGTSAGTANLSLSGRGK